MTICFTNIIKKVYKNIWLDRCQKVVELEKANNIFKKDKRKRGNVNPNMIDLLKQKKIKIPRPIKGI